MAVLKAQQLRVVKRNTTGTATKAHWVAMHSYGRLRVAVLNANGNLYVATDENPGHILRVVPG